MKKKILIGIIALIGLPCLALGSWLLISYLQFESAPAFDLQQKLSENGLFMESTLISGNTRYFQTAAEFSLAPSGSRLFNLPIGKQGQQEIYRVPGNDDYVMLTGFMFPAMIFRKESAAPIDFGTLQVGEIQYFGEQGGVTVEKTTHDAALIGEVLRQLRQTARPLPGNAVSMATIRLFSDSLPGLYDYFNVQLYSDHAACFISAAAQDYCIPAGPLFTKWVTP